MLWTHAELTPNLFSFGRDVVLSLSCFEITTLRQLLDEVAGFDSDFLRQFRGCYLIGGLLIGFGRWFRFLHDRLDRNTHFIADADDALSLFVGIYLSLIHI